MCASYGLGGGPYLEGERFALDPMDTRESRAVIDGWMAARSGKAAITGRNARNLNPIIRAAADGERSIDLAWWWIWLDGTGPVKFSAFNSRDDKLTRSWRGPFQYRALLPATWYVEKGVRFGLPDASAFGIAALTSTVVNEQTGEQLTTYSMVTRTAVGEPADTWHRMPLVLPHEMHDVWLDSARSGDESLVAEAQHASVEISSQMTAVNEPSVARATLFDL